MPLVNFHFLTREYFYLSSFNQSVVNHPLSFPSLSLSKFSKMLFSPETFKRFLFVNQFQFTAVRICPNLSQTSFVLTFAPLVWPVMAPLFKREEEREANRDSEPMLGPMALKMFGSEKGWKSSSGNEGLNPESRFSQNSCRGFSANKRFLSILVSFASDLWI